MTVESDSGNIAWRLYVLEQIEAIKQLKYRYFQASDGKDPETFRSCFADGPIVIEYGRIGSYRHRDEITKVFHQLACQEHIVEMHHGQNPIIEIIDADRARGSWGLYYHMINTRDRNITQFGGAYTDEYVRCDEAGWQMSRSEFHQRSSQLLDYNETTVRMLFGGRVAPQEVDDPNQQA